ncbi:MAG: signal peptidase I [Capsulimonadales bacterium]|nr:signal peptidase I [Capsulimonadales bacterium]
MEPTPLQDQLANISPVWVVAIVAFFTMIRVALAKSNSSWARTISETCDTINFVLVLAFLLIRPFVAQAFYIPSESMESTLLVKDRLIVNKFQYRFANPQRQDVVVFEAPPQATGDKAGVDFIKRLIALPGDTIQVKAPELRINGEPIDPQGEAGNLHDYLRNRLGLTGDDAIKIFPDHVLVNGKVRYSREKIAEAMNQPGAKITLTPGRTYVNGKVQEEPYTREDPDYDFPSDGSVLKLAPDEFFMMGDNRNRSADSHYWGPLKRQRVVGKAVFVFWPPNRIGAIK